MNKIREKIMKTLRALSETVGASENYLRIYQQDEKFLDRAEELYIAVLAAVEGMIAWLDHSTYSKL
jgi:hypothetical protein